MYKKATLPFDLWLASCAYPVFGPGCGWPDGFYHFCTQVACFQAGPLGNLIRRKKEIFSGADLDLGWLKRDSIMKFGLLPGFALSRILIFFHFHGPIQP